MAKPRMRASNRRSIVVRVPMNPSERAALRAIARRWHVSQAEVVRRLAREESSRAVTSERAV